MRTVKWATSLRRRERISPRNQWRRFQRKRFSNACRNGSHRNCPQRTGEVPNQEAGEGKHQDRNRCRLKDPRQYAGDLPEMLCSSGDLRKLSRSEIDRRPETNDRGRSGKGRCRSSVERECRPEIPGIAIGKKSRLAINGRYGTELLL